MAFRQTKIRPKVWDDFSKNSWRYDFWKALTLARKLYPDRRVRFKIRPRLCFAPGPVAGFTKSPDGTSALYVNLTGLSGPESPVPLWQTELTERLALHGEPSLAEFLDIFNDRLVNLHQELMSRLKPECGAEQAAPYVGKYFLAAAGVLTEGIMERILSIPCSGPQGNQPGKLPAASFISASAVWGMFPRSASGLEFLVEKVLGVKAGVEPLKGAWTFLPDEHRSRLGQGKNQLGRDTISGSRIFDPAAGFSLKIGPLTAEQYRDFVPPPAGGKRIELAALIKLYLGDDCPIDYCLLNMPG